MTLSIMTSSITVFNVDDLCHYAVSFMLSVAIESIMLSVAILNAIMVNVVARRNCYTDKESSQSVGSCS